jgi:hypothetical protein
MLVPRIINCLLIATKSQSFSFASRRNLPPRHQITSIFASPSAKDTANGDDKSVNDAFGASTASTAQPSFDGDSEYDGDLFSLCFLSDDEDDYSCDTPLPMPYPSEREGDKAMAYNLILRYIPLLMPLLAYSTYELTAKVFDGIVELISNNNWVAVDGGAYQSSIITPAINGLVVPSMALLFATLMSNTINTLRQRQMQIRTSLNIEANDLRMLSVMVDSIPDELRDSKNRLRRYLIQYASRVMRESEPGLSFDNQKLMGSIDSEINGFLRVLNSMGVSQYSTMYVDTMVPAAEYEINSTRFTHVEKDLGVSAQQRQISSAFLPPYVFSEMYGALTRLRHERSVRLSALQSTYPPLHYAILALLGCSICGVFLMETNQNVLIFLTAIQLRILWAMLIGTFSSLAVVNYDM